MSEPTNFDSLLAEIAFMDTMLAGHGYRPQFDPVLSVKEVCNALTLANRRAEAAEAERDETVAGAEYRRKLLTALETRCAAAEAERDALRKVDDAMVERAARVLVKQHADECGVDERDVWNIYGDDFKANARAALDAVLAVQP